MVDRNYGLQLPVISRNTQPGSAAHHLPVLVGRDGELAELAELLAASGPRLLTVTGTAGVGKSRLARAALCGKEFEGTWRTPAEPGVAVDLAECADRAAAWNAVLAAVGGRPLGIVRPVAGVDSILALLAARIRDAPATLLLDNCDRLIEAIPADVAALLDRCPRLVIVATSRAPLHLRGEHIVRVRPLPGESGDGDYYPAASPAARLLLDSIDSHYRGLAALADRLVLDDIVRELDGVPLALELAAGAIARLGPVRTLHRIKAGADLQSPFFVDVPARHRGMDAAVGWGVSGLDPDVLELLLRLSLFEAPFDLETACLVSVIDEERTGAAIAELVDRSLLEHDPAAPATAAYRLFATVRAWCRRVLAAEPERAERIRWAHVDRLCRLATVLGPLLRCDGERADAMAKAGARIADLLAALHHLLETGQPERAVAAAARLEPVWVAHGYLAEVESLLARTLRTDELGAASAALCRQVLGIWALRTARLHRSVELLTDAVAGYRNSGDPVGAAGCAVVLGTALCMLGDDDGARRQLRSAALRADRLSEELVGWLEVAQAMTEIPLPARRDGTGWAVVRDRVREFELPIRLPALYMLARTQLAPETLDRALLLLREVLGTEGIEAHLLPAINALEGCALAYFAAGGDYREVAATLSMAARHLREVHAIPPLAAEDCSMAEPDYRNALGEERFRAVARRGSEMDLAAAITYARSAPLLRAPDESPLAALTNRQREIARLVATGMTNRMIATHLRISEWTVVNHVRQVMFKLDCPSRLHVALLVERESQPFAETDPAATPTA